MQFDRKTGIVIGLVVLLASAVRAEPGAAAADVASVPAPSTAPSEIPQTRSPTTSPSTRDAPGIFVDTSQVPELADYGQKVQAVAEKWYPIIVARLPGDDFTAPAHVEIIFKKDMKGVAYTTGGKVSASPKYFTAHQDDLGAFVHELVHVVQAYHHKTPGWIVEGIADYIRFFSYEPESARPHPNPDKAKYTDSYRTSAHFLNYVAETYDKDFVVKLNAACRAGKYTDDFWKEQTGKTLEELGAAWKETLRKPE